MELLEERGASAPVTTPVQKSRTNVLRWMPAASTTALLAFAGVLIVINTLMLFVDYNPFVGALTLVFAFGLEQSLATWFSSFVLAYCAVLIGLIAWERTTHKMPFARHWAYLCMIFFALSADEVAGFHENVSVTISGVVETSGLFFFAWVIPALVIVVGFALAYASFAYHLPPRIRWWFIGALATFIFGALGMEMLSGLYLDYRPRDGWFSVMIIIEEGTEMLGACWLAHAMLVYVREYCNIQVNLSSTPVESGDDDRSSE
jgi:hypothetical protein